MVPALNTLSLRVLLASINLTCQAHSVLIPRFLEPLSSFDTLPLYVCVKNGTRTQFHDADVISLFKQLYTSLCGIPTSPLFSLLLVLAAATFAPLKSSQHYNQAYTIPDDHRHLFIPSPAVVYTSFVET